MRMKMDMLMGLWGVVDADTTCLHRLIFPRWDVIAIILSIFLLTYTYIEARSNYHRGSILVLA
jgi:Ca2+/H+ antiporter